MRKILSQSFYNRPTLSVARELLGKFLVYDSPQGRLAGKITETEAYVGFQDKASHASKGLTPRTALMYGEAGRWYIYLIYGFYHCLNIVTESKDYPAAVLIRAVEPVEGIELMKKNRDVRESKKSVKFDGRQISPPDVEIKLANGPGKLCQAFGIAKDSNGAKAFGCSAKRRADKNSRLFIEDRGVKVKESEIAAAKRVGVDYAGEWKDKEWRFYLKNNPYISKK